jgi:uncharacterized protein (TIGR02466 family)
MADLKARICWCTPILEATNPAHSTIKDGLLAHIRQLAERDGSAVASGIAPGAKVGLYESPFDFFESADPAVQGLKAFCESALRNAMQFVDAQIFQGAHKMQSARINLHESWVHVTRDGGFHSTHYHANCSWCGIYYVDAGDSGGDPPNGVSHFLPPFISNYEDLGTKVCGLDTVVVVPREGNLVLFPSFVRHSAAVYRGSRDRIVIAFNARINPASK